MWQFIAMNVTSMYRKEWVWSEHSMYGIIWLSGKGGRNCPDGYFRCGTGACKNMTLTCDGVQDCRDSTDERNKHAGCEGIYRDGCACSVWGTSISIWHCLLSTDFLVYQKCVLPG